MKIFNTEGRIRRTEYALNKLNSLLVLFASVFVLQNFTDAGWLGEEVKMLLFFGFIILYFVTSMASTIKRLHDLNKKGTFWFMLLVPIYNFVLGLGLLFQQGTDGVNRFGSNPRLEGNLMSIYKRNLIPLVFLVGLIGFSINLSKKQTIQRVNEAINSPAVNDCFIYESDDDSEYKYSVFKVANIKDDTLTLRVGKLLFVSANDAERTVKEKQYSLDELYGGLEILPKAELQEVNIKNVVK